MEALLVHYHLHDLHDYLLFSSLGALHLHPIQSAHDRFHFLLFDGVRPSLYFDLLFARFHTLLIHA